jgi:hypothetical protein
MALLGCKSSGAIKCKPIGAITVVIDNQVVQFCWGKLIKKKEDEMKKI